MTMIPRTKKYLGFSKIAAVAGELGLLCKFLLVIDSHLAMIATFV